MAGQINSASINETEPLKKALEAHGMSHEQFTTLCTKANRCNLQIDMNRALLLTNKYGKLWLSMFNDLFGGDPQPPPPPSQSELVTQHEKESQHSPASPAHLTPADIASRKETKEDDEPGDKHEGGGSHQHAHKPTHPPRHK